MALGLLAAAWCQQQLPQVRGVTGTSHQDFLVLRICRVHLAIQPYKSTNQLVEDNSIAVVGTAEIRV